MCRVSFWTSTLPDHSKPVRPQQASKPVWHCVTIASLCKCVAHLFLCHYISQADAHSRQDTGVSVDEDGLHAQGTSNSTSMLSSCPSKACECMRGRVIPLHLGQGSDGAAHGLIRHLDESHGNLGVKHMRLTNTWRCAQACTVTSNSVSLAAVANQQSCFVSSGCQRTICKQDVAV